MKCSDVVIMLPEYFRGKTSEASSGNISEHLNTCSSCKAESIHVQAMVDLIRKEKAWEPDSFYWNSIIPKVQDRIEQRRNRSRFEWIIRFIMPAAAAASVLIILLTSLNMPNSDNRYTDNLNLNSIPVSELSEYYTVQSAFSEFNQLSLDSSGNEESADTEILKEIVAQDDNNIVSSYFDDKEILDLISQENETAIVAALQK
ncbi:MAG: hypothetical protein C0417_12085 [Chlorobiaceae bacterium]|nr:hypothetical protein [Chlorobiaceae bacterium]